MLHHVHLGCHSGQTVAGVLWPHPAHTAKALMYDLHTLPRIVTPYSLGLITGIVVLSITQFYARACWDHWLRVFVLFSGLLWASGFWTPAPLMKAGSLDVAAHSCSGLKKLYPTQICKMHMKSGPRQLVLLLQSHYHRSNHPLRQHLWDPLSMSISVTLGTLGLSSG